MSSFHFKPRDGFTLIEILASLAVMSIFTVVTLSSLDGVVDDARFSATVREIEQIRNAFVGETQRLETGLRKNYGYLGDMGGLPTSSGLAALSTMPAGVTSWAMNSTYGIGVGWRGPYLENTFEQDFTKDAWGRAYIYTYSGGAANIKSLGSDGAVGGTGYAQDISVDIPLNVTKGKLLGYIVKASGDLMGADQLPYIGPAQVTLYYPNGSGGVTSSTATLTSANNGKYEFSSIPLGYATVKIFIPNSSAATQTLGPSLIEINKAAAAAVPVAQDVSSVYGALSACTTSQNFSLVPDTFVKNDVADTVAFQVGVSSSDVVWTGNFRHEEAVARGLDYFTVSNSALGTRSFGLTGSTVSAGGASPIPAGTNYTMDTVAPPILKVGLNTITFKYTTPWSAANTIFYYEIACKFFGLHPDDAP